uniref:Putative prophage phiRv2 integrase n=1 Tax=uncultured organism TaxID=155900 RepID=A0A7L9QC53_9ZZZZ|nr:putative prophage phiRv2 integrase [uncultured organism]
MSHVEKRGPKRYMAVWTDPNGRKRSKSFPRKIDAERHLTVTDASLLRRDWVDPDNGKMTFADYAAQWVDVRDVRETTRRKYRQDVAQAAVLAGIPLGRITPNVIEQWQSAALKTHKRSTVITMRATLAAVMTSAVRDRRIASNPFHDVPRIKPEPHRIRLMSAEQIDAVRDDITPWYSAAVEVGASCGLRPGEIFGLTAGRINRKANVIHVERTLIRTKARGQHLGPPKTAASVRTVPMPDNVSKALAAHMLRYGTGEDGLIFHSRGGKPVDAGLRANAWRRVAPAGTRWHDLRHFYASAQIAGGATVLEVQTLLGHATAQETLNTYSHLWPDHGADRAISRIEAARKVEQVNEDQSVGPRV